MPYKLTPYDRRVQAQLMREQRLGGSYKAMKKREQEAAQAASLAKEQEKEDGNWFTGLLETIGDVGANLVTGLGKGLEGIYDLGAGAVGAVGGLFSDDFEKSVQKHIAKDHVGEWFGNDWQAALDESWLNDSTVGGIIEGVAQGVGQLLPAVGVSLIPGVGTALGAKLALGTTMASAAGTGAEQAFQEGADYGEGMLYGLVSGGIEGATEALTPGLGGLYGKSAKVFGKLGKGVRAAAKVGKEVAEEVVETGVKEVAQAGLKEAAKAGLKATAGQIGKETADVGLKRVAKSALGEGVEEMLSEVAAPATKAIYKGKEAFEEYGEADFWGGVLEAGVIGAGTDLAYGRTIGRALKTTGVYGDARSVAEHIEEQRKKIDTGELSPEAEVQAQKNIKSDMELLSKRLQRVSQKTRDNILRDPGMALNFDTDGKIKAEIAEKLDANIRAAGDTSSGLDRRYYSASARGREAQIIEGLAAQGTKVVEGDLSADEDVAYKKAKEMHSKLKKTGFVETDLVLAETMPDANAYLDGRTVVIGKDSLADGSYVKHLVHETTHFTEGTQEWLDVMDHVFGKDGSAVEHLIERVKTSGYGVTDADVAAVLDAVREGKLKDAALTEKQRTLVTEVVAMQMEETFGSEEAINRLVGEKPSLAKRILERIKAFLQAFGKKSKSDPEAVENLRRTEELFRKALEKAGVGYAHDELTRMNEKKMRVSEENGGEGVDESGEVRYNGGEVKSSLKRQRYISYDQLGKNTVYAIRNRLYELYRGVGDSIANDVAVEIGDTVYVVDSGKDKGKISFGVKEILVIDDANVRQQVRRDINDRAVSKGIVSDAISEKVGRASDQYRASGHERELQEKLSTDQGKSQHQQRGVLDGDGNRGVGGERGYFSDTVDQNAGAFDSWAQTVPDDPAGERNYLLDVENRGRKVGADDLYEGEQERNRTGNQESGGYDRRIDLEEADGLIQRLRELLAQLDAEPSSKVQKSRKVQYSKAGKTARTADQLKLSTAQQMIEDGLDSETVRKATGWFQGYDKEWRFEIDDSKMEFSREGFYPDMKKELSREFQAIQSKIFAKRNSEQRFKELITQLIRVEKLMKRIPNSPLERFVKHDELFAAYPQLRQIKLVLRDGDDCTYVPKQNTIYLNSRLSDGKIRRNLIHEIQHAVQEIEGFAMGSNTSYWETQIEGKPSFEYEKSQSNLMNSGLFLQKNLAPEMIPQLNQLLPNAVNLRAMKYEDYPEDVKRLLEQTEDEVRHALILYISSYGKLLELDKRYEGNHPEALYWRTAGEIEARDVANRLDMDAEQRKSTRPDIDRTDVVFADRGSNFWKSKARDEKPWAVGERSLKSVDKSREKRYNEYTGEQYENFGWVRANDVLNSGEWKDFTSKFADAVSGKVHTPITKGGEYMIAVSDIDDALHYGTDNIIVYAKGSIESPQVSRVLKIDLDNETDLDQERRNIYAAEGRGIQPKAGGLYRLYDSTDYRYRSNEQRNSSQRARNNSQLGTDRGGGRKTTDRIEEFKVNDDGSFTTVYADGRAVTEPPKVRRSRKVTGETVTISKGEMAKLHANYAGDKVFIKKDVAAAIKTIDALQKLPAAMRNELVTRLWRGYNERLNEQGFELFTELAWHQMHAEILQESGFEMSEDEIAKMDEQIVNALHQIVASGKPSIKARLESDTSTEGYRKQAQFWRDEHGKAVEYHKRLNTLKYELEKLANQKKGLYVNAANFRGDSFKVAIDELAKMNWRGGLVSAGKIREHFAKLAAWYTKENPLYKGDGGTASLFKQEIADALNSLGNSQNGALTAEDLMAAETVVKYFAHEIEAHNTVFKDGKRVDAMPEAKEYIEKVRRAKEIAAKCGIWSNLMRSKFARMVADPAMLMRQADGYLNGFFTEQYEALRQGTIDAAVLERELSEEFEQFWEKNKAYAKRYNDATVTFDGKEMPLQEAISLYMTMNREHSHAGLAGAGFDIEGKKAIEEISAGFSAEVNRQLAEDWKALPPDELLTLTKKKNAEMEQAALAKVVEQKRQALYDQFTAEDKALIELMERAFEKCRDVKVKIDEIVQGYSNVTGGYYYPIKRTGLAENVDAYTGFEGDRVTNLSMNKETVKNAHKLLIEPAHIVFMRHLKATSLYHGLGVFTDNFNRLYNLNIGSNANNPITVRTALGQSNKFTQEMIKYFKELKQDVEGISKKRSQERAYNDAVAFIRSSYATYQLGANPKVWVTQLSSYIAAHGLIDADCLVKGLSVSGKDVDEFCRLAWLRNNDSSAAQAQAVGSSQNAVQRAGRNALQKIRDLAMLPIGKVDRLVITRLFGACQVQVEKKGGAKVGTKENKIEAGKLLQRVILETQQNSLATERSAAMRSSDELLKGFTMFSADAMKVGARFVDAFGELSVLKTLRKEAKKAGNGAEAERLQKEIKRARKQCVRATVSLVGVALFNAALAYAFKWLYRRDEEENVGTVVADTFGNMLGGIPFVRDLWSFFQDGFEMDHFLISTVNDVLGTAAASFELVGDAMDGKEITKQDVMGTMRKISYAAGQLSGLPVRNVYNFGTGILNRVSPEAGYEVESLFFKQAYASDLQKAIDAGDDEMVGTIAGLMIDEKIGIEDNAMRKALQELIAKGHSVLPRSVGDSVTVNGETMTLTATQQKKLRKVYAIGQEAVADMVKLKQFGEADEKVQAAAIKFVYDVYWDLALEDALGLDLAEKNVLFAEAIDIEKLAIIIATARAIEADKDKSGKAISGTKKRKVQTFVNSLRLSAAEKYMVMGYLGYANANGEGAVKAHIGKLNLSKSEKEKLLGYSGY